jgi:hypothetical protein
MSDNARSSKIESAAAQQQPRRSTPQRRPRTAYAIYRRYRLWSRLAALLGAVSGVALVAYSLVPIMLAGDRVPPTSFVVAAIIVAAAALVPYFIVRWRWRRIKATLDDA